MSSPIATLDDLKYVQMVYNLSLEHMATTPLEPVSTEKQIDWWLKGDKRGWILWGADWVDPVGFIILTEKGGFETPMFAIYPRYRGQHYAREFIDTYIGYAKGALAGEQLQSNEIICRLNKDAGWEVVLSKDGVDYLYHPGVIATRIAEYLGKRAGI